MAVKKLQGIHQHLDRIELEFDREIEVMRTIRHPNIVLFLGGGRYHDDGCQFVVVEYMARGSLATVLEDEDIELEDSLKLRFALEAAKGLRFFTINGLHECTVKVVSVGQPAMGSQGGRFWSSPIGTRRRKTSRDC